MVRDLSRARSQLFRIIQISNEMEPRNPMKYSNRHISHARFLMDTMPALPNIYPKFGKSFLFSFGNSSSQFIELELFEDASVRAFYRRRDGKCSTKNMSIYSVADFLKQFFSEDFYDESSTG